VSVCPLVTTVSPTETAEQIEVPFGVWTRVGPWNHLLDGGGRCGAHWRHLTNRIERFVRGGDASIYQITLTTCYN